MVALRADEHWPVRAKPRRPLLVRRDPVLDRFDTEDAADAYMAEHDRLICGAPVEDIRVGWQKEREG